VHTVSLNESRQRLDISSHKSSSAKHGKDSGAKSVRTKSPHLNMQVDSVSR
jgi:hypothetical protein